MKILTPENVAFDINDMPNEIDDIRYGVLDYSDQSNVDYYFIPLIFLDNFPRPAADLQLGKFRIQMPLDWSIVIVDKHSGAIEILELKNINDREFDAWGFNPINGYMPSFLPINILNIYPDVNWFFPKLKYGHILAVPLEDGPSPMCVYFVKDTNKLPEVLDITKLM
jgi:hypothetical protein